MTKRPGKIALCLSGGGVRAVGFHLGTLEMLNRLGLLENVKILSTASGGSLPGIGYALSQRYERSFDQYFEEFYEFLPKLNTIEQLLKGLAGKAFPAPSDRRRNMITVMANIYDEYYFRKFFADSKGETPRFSVFLNSGQDDLTEVVFNATEFQTGTAFRFQTSGKIGNGNISLCKCHAEKIRIADIMAASSCIPAGMEPMFFPDDFHWPDNNTCTDIQAELKRNLKTGWGFFALMDGGVVDNQGIHSLLLAIKRQLKREDRSSDTPTELLSDFKAAAGAGYTLMISDTPVRKDSFYPKIPDEHSIEFIPGNRRPGKRSLLDRLTIGWLVGIGWLATLLLLGSATVTMWEQWAHNRPEEALGGIAGDILQVAIPLLATLGLAGLLVAARSKALGMSKKLFALLPADRWKNKRPWSLIKKIRLVDLFDMVTLRVGSMSALSASIFMNRIRSLGYSAVYSQPELNDDVLTNRISHLAELSDPSSNHKWPPCWPKEGPDKVQPLSGAARDIVNVAAQMKTKLWINEQPDLLESEGLNDLDVLVICGQMTTCYNVMRYLWHKHRADSEWKDREAKQQFDSACEIWNCMQVEPAALLKQNKLKFANG